MVWMQNLFQKLKNKLPAGYYDSILLKLEPLGFSPYSALLTNTIPITNVFFLIHSSAY